MAVVLTAAGCGDDDDTGTDTGPRIDSGQADSGGADTGVADAGVTDTGPTDANVGDVGASDTGLADSGFVDAGASDTGTADTGPVECGVSGDDCSSAPCCDGFMCCNGLPLNDHCFLGETCPISDVNQKRGFASVDVHDVLDRVNALSIQTWEYRTDANGVRHMGPMAQDFRHEFGLGPDEHHIWSVDGNGVALAAIQALSQEMQQLREENRELRHEIEQLRKQR